MNIETKFNVGDKAFTIDSKTLKIKEFEVSHISTYTSSKGTGITLFMKDETMSYGYGEGVDECKCFHDKESLITHITKP